MAEEAEGKLMALLKDLHEHGYINHQTCNLVSRMIECIRPLGCLEDIHLHGKKHWLAACLLDGSSRLVMNVEQWYSLALEAARQLPNLKALEGRALQEGGRFGMRCYGRLVSKAIISGKHD